MQEESEVFMYRFVRERAVAPLDPTAPGLSPRERRSSWEFCLWMHEFLSNIIKDRLVNEYQAQQLSRLSWIMLRGTYVFTTSDPMMRGEQRRFAELCKIIGAVFPVVVDDPQGIRDGLEFMFGSDRFWRDGKSKEPAETEALMENRLRWWRDWENDSTPIDWVKKCAAGIHRRDHIQGGYIAEKDALYSTPEKKRDHNEASLAFDYRDAARDVMPLEEVSELRNVVYAGLEPRYTATSITKLEAEIRDDEDVRAYAQLRHRGWKRRTTWEHLGWQAKHGEAVDRRYRRFRAAVVATGFDYEGRQIELNPGLSDASCTVVMERLRIPVHPASEATLSGRVVYEPRSYVEHFGELTENKRKINLP